MASEKLAYRLEGASWVDPGGFDQGSMVATATPTASAVPGAPAPVVVPRLAHDKLNAKLFPRGKPSPKSRLKDHDAGDRLPYTALASADALTDEETLVMVTVTYPDAAGVDRHDLTRKLKRYVASDGGSLRWFGVWSSAPQLHHHVVLPVVKDSPQWWKLQVWLCQTFKTPARRLWLKHNGHRAHVRVVTNLPAAVRYLRRHLNEARRSPDVRAKFICSHDLRSDAEELVRKDARTSRQMSREARRETQDSRQAQSATTPAADPAALSSVLRPGLAALFDEDALMLVRVVKANVRELGLPIEVAVSRTIAAWSILREDRLRALAPVVY